MDQENTGSKKEMEEQKRREREKERKKKLQKTLISRISSII